MANLPRGIETHTRLMTLHLLTTLKLPKEHLHMGVITVGMDLLHRLNTQVRL